MTPLAGTSSPRAAALQISSESSSRPGLPEDWSCERDLLVLYGCAGREVAEGLHASGQARLILFDPEAASSQSLAAGVAVVRRLTELMQVIQMIEGPPPALVRLRKLPGASLAPADERELLTTLQCSWKAWLVNRNTLDSFGELWLRQLVQNMGRVALNPSVAELNGAFADRPCVIVSPGPSLEKNVALLREVADRALIISCTHALSALEQVGVVPDVVVIGDAKGLAWQYADYDFTRVEALVQMAGGSEQVFDLPARRTFTYGFSAQVDLWLYEVLGKQALLASGGSVACVALSLALRLGCPEVIYVGQDLALDGERYYADSVRDGSSTVRVAEGGGSFVLDRRLPVDEYNRRGLEVLFTASQPLLSVPGFHGGEVRSSESLTVFRDWFTLVTKSELCRARVFNCTEGGAYIDGMLHLPLRQVLARLRPLEGATVAERLDERLSSWDAQDARRRVSECIESMDKGLSRCQWLVQQCAKVLKRARKRPTELDTLARHEAELQQVLDAIPMASLVASREIRRVEQQGATAGTLAQNLDATERLLGVVQRALRMMQEPLGEARRQLARAASERAGPRD